MIGKRQLALLSRARNALDLDAPQFTRLLQDEGGVTEPEKLTATGFNDVMDRCTVQGFRDTQRPILSKDTRDFLMLLFELGKVTQLEFETVMRGRGRTGDLRLLTGDGLLNLLVYIESRGVPIIRFQYERRQVTPKQISLIHFARTSVRLSESSYSEILQVYGGVNKSSDLDRRGVDLIMAYFRSCGFTKAHPRPAVSSDIALGSRAGFASPSQLALIRELWAEWSSGLDDAGLVTWLERSYQVSALRFLTASTASAAITALKAMKRRKAEPSKVTA